MRDIRSKQKGLTLGGLIFVLSFVGVVVLFAVRAFPLYNEKMQVVSAVNTIVADPEAGGMTDKEIRDRFLANMYATTNIRRFDEKNVKDYIIIDKPKKAGEAKTLRLQYEARGPLVYDLELLLVVDQAFPLRGNAGGE